MENIIKEKELKVKVIEKEIQKGLLNVRILKEEITKLKLRQFDNTLKEKGITFPVYFWEIKVRNNHNVIVDEEFCIIEKSCANGIDDNVKKIPNNAVTLFRITEIATDDYSRNTVIRSGILRFKDLKESIIPSQTIPNIPIIEDLSYNGEYFERAKKRLSLMWKNKKNK